MHELTRAKARRVRFRAWLWNGTEYQIHFDLFRVENRSTNYTLKLGGYNSNASIGVPSSCEENFLYNNGKQFRTKDRDKDAKVSGNCIQKFGGAGWWYATCTKVAPNVKFCPSKNCGRNRENIKVRCLMGDTYSMKRFQIDIFINHDCNGRIDCSYREQKTGSKPDTCMFLLLSL